MTTLLTTFKKISLFLLLVAIVLLINAPFISSDVMYPEQALFYLANQQIHHLHDLLTIYLHPHLFSDVVPFFRPSGHFLMYQLLTPFLGWHNTRALLIVNFIFLALTGYVMIKLYNRLFPGYKMGGYIAFGLYLMHPALTLSRLIIMHFEFAHTFFLVLSLYLFVLFCQRNTPMTTTLRASYLLMSSLFFYVVAVTFKETALLLGPVLALYFLLTFSNQLLRQKQVSQILLLITAITISLTLYLTLAWPTLASPTRGLVTTSAEISAAIEMIRVILCWPHAIHVTSLIDSASVVWRPVINTNMVSVIIASFIFFTLISNILLINNKKHLLFLYLTALLFLILPIGWAMAMPWHLSLTLLFLSMAIAYSVEYLLKKYLKNPSKILWATVLMLTLIAFAAFKSNQANLHRYQSNAFSFMALNRNAVLYPPTLPPLLNKNSVIVIEDNNVHSNYKLGAASYPFNVNSQFNYTTELHNNALFFIKYDPYFNGTLFRWAYLQPSLKEELYPFDIHQMQAVPNEVIYHWLQSQDNIFNFAYDANAAWVDQTILFRENLSKEKLNRHLMVNTYAIKKETAIYGKNTAAMSLPYPDPTLCQYRCDQNKQCLGFTFIDAAIKKSAGAPHLMQCLFYEKTLPITRHACAACTQFVKI